MSSLPVHATKEQQEGFSRPGDATVVRGIAAVLVILALAAILAIERPAAYGVAATILVSALALFAAARWRRSAA